ncbi:MAG TPA: M14 family zinc carboxypeptidase [Ignavibacteria bacterium]|nr:M14 family zinc carboxypeptidase [Ignavibacteria bacterium]
MKTFLSTTLIFIIAVFLLRFDFQQNYESNPYEKYSEVKIRLNSSSDIQRLQMSGIDVEHYTGHIHEGITVVINQAEITRLKNSGFAYEITIPDMDEYHANRQPSSPQDLERSEQIKRSDNIDGFEYGTMGGHYKYDEVVRELDSFRLQYPNLITVKQDRGTTAEGRKIWMVKVSDNPDANESATEAPVYYDAVHHAREPISMMAMMYYINYLLDNYASNPEVQYLVNNREIFFVPIVNPDGYVYNQTTNPNGGGNWRKNRRNNGSCFGVDLNRNYSYGYGLNSGSSNDPCSDTYRGPSANSEPESQAIKNIVDAVRPKIAFSMHSVAGRYLNPYGYNDSSVSYEIYSEFAGDFAPSNNYLYGTVIEMLDYYSSGTTRDYLHSIGTYCWTPELGGSGFWPSQATIIPICNENLYGLKYLTWVSGAYADFKSWKLNGKGWGYRNDTLQIQVDIKNKGLSKTSKNVEVTMSSLSGLASPLVTSINYDSIPSRSLKNNASNPFKFIVSNSANVGDEVKLMVLVKQENVETSRDTISFYVGARNTLFLDNAENGISKWTRAGTGLQWDTSYVSNYSGLKSFADSRYGNSNNSSNNSFTLIDTINLANTVKPKIEFDAKWATESTFDYARIQVSSNFGSTWTSMPGKYTRTVSSQPSYTDIKSWVNEQIDLTSYIGQKIRIRFTYFTDSGLPGDGIYVDNFRVVDYRSSLVGAEQISSSVPDRFGLKQNYPNPFNPATTFEFSIAKTEFVNIKIYDISGKEISSLVNQIMNPGIYKINFDASNFASGTYFYKITAGSFSDIKKMVLLK